MMLGFFFLILPLCLFVVLTALPQGRFTGLGFGVVAAILAAAWALLIFGLPPFNSGNALSDGIMRGALTIYTGTTIAAAVAQRIRHHLPADRPGWLYPMIAFAILLLGGFPALTFLGV